MPKQKRSKISREDAFGEIQLGNRTFWLLDGPIDNMAGVATAKLFLPEDGCKCAVRFGSDGLGSEAKRLERANRYDPLLPRVVCRGKHRKYGHYLVTTWVGGDDNLQAIVDRDEQIRGYYSDAVTIYHAFVPFVSSLLNLHHVARIVHGDIKLENIVLTSKGKITLIDFGFAFSIERTSQRPLDRGTRYYASPEQWNGALSIDHRADQFSASVVLYRLLTGRLPFEGMGGSINETCATAELPSRFNPDVWPELDEVVVRGLSLDRERRFRTTRIWLDELSAATSGNIFFGLRRWVRKRLFGHRRVREYGRSDRGVPVDR